MTIRNSVNTMPKHGKHDWATFDSLPREIKEILWNAVGDLTSSSRYIPASFAPHLAEHIAKQEREATARTYGLDHPQARLLAQSAVDELSALLD